MCRPGVKGLEVGREEALWADRWGVHEGVSITRGGMRADAGQSETHPCWKHPTLAGSMM